MRVAVYTISLNEAPHVDRFLRACGGADLVIVADTGSTDNTVEALRRGGAIVHKVGIRPWRFDTARNVALALVPLDVDVCIALDLDEVLSPGWRDDIEANWTAKSTRGHYIYTWSHRADGSADVQFWSDKIHARQGYVWRHICHEALYPDRLAETHVYLKRLRIDHWPDDSKSRSQYLPLLEAAIAEAPQGAREAFYLGREYFVLGRYAEAGAELRRYLALPGATWQEQNAHAMAMIAACCEASGDADGGLDWRRAATRAAPERRDGWVELADGLYRRQLWSEARHAAERALALSDAPTASANPRRSGRPDPADLASIAAWHCGDRHAALLHAEAALGRNPSDMRLAANVAAIRRSLGEARRPLP